MPNLVRSTVIQRVSSLYMNASMTCWVPSSLLTVADTMSVKQSRGQITMTVSLRSQNHASQINSALARKLKKRRKLNMEMLRGTTAACLAPRTKEGLRGYQRVPLMYCCVAQHSEHQSAASFSLTCKAPPLSS